MGATSFSSLVIVVIAAFLTPILLHRLRLKFIPVVVGEILAGLVIGKSGFDWIHQGSWIQILSTLGFIYLLFLSGLEIDFSVFGGKKKRQRLENGRKEPNGVALAFTVFMMVLSISCLLALLFAWIGLVHNVFLMAIIIATISLGIVVPTIKDMGIVKSNIGQTILLITAVGDLATMILLAVLVSMLSKDSGSTWLILVLFAAGILLYLVGKFFRSRSFLETMSRGTIHIDTRAVFALIIVFVALSKSLGVDIILGSFLAGALVSLLSPDPVMVQKLDSFGYGFLIPIFFVMTGVKLDIWSLFSDPSILFLMLLLFVAFFIAKLIPAMWIKRWYGWRTAFSIGFLVSAKLTLVIAAVRVGQDLNLISNSMASAIILVSVISCLVGPIMFKQLFPHEHGKAKRTRVVILGANQMTLPLSLELNNVAFDVHIYHASFDQEVNPKAGDSVFSVREIPNYRHETLQNAGVYDTDILVVASNRDQINADIAEKAKELVRERVIARIETSELSDSLRAKEVEVYSSFFSTKAILKAMIQSPSVVDILTTEDNGLFQIEVADSKYAGMKLSRFPYLGDTIIVRIYRDNQSIVPHGNTELKMGDRLIVTGSKAHVDRMQEMLGI